MHFIKKQRNKPLYKKFLPLRKNVQSRNKFLNFKKKKWEKFQYSQLRFKKQRFYDPISYFLSNFKNFFNKKFKYNLQNKQRLSLFYGKLRKKCLKRTVKSVQKKFKGSNRHPSVLFIEKLESRLDTALYRTHFSYSFSNARQIISHKKIYVNNKMVQYNSYLLKKGDLITLDKEIFEFTISNILNSKICPIPPKHFYVNYKTLQILVIEHISYANCLMYYPFWIDFSSFLKFYER
jgi:ribosomal protein S4|uniref:Ribosomal protein S4 n=1 Tax=Thalassiosira nordenskioeldii TaxID=83372 RepID=A0A891GQ84_THANO|nr:ribosomal protein S4 [Thalassiosira nordenskioeldii]QRK25918.1 ribosomal protein S4 [Thalassiosira nordenskioeldii]